MSWQQFFDVLGLPIQDLRAAWPEEPRLEDRAARTKKKFDRIYSALVQRRRAIESLRLDIERDERRKSDDAFLRIERNRRQLLRRESNYQLLLARMARTKRKLARLQFEIRAVK
jgi:hypothetical protein